MSVRLRRRTNCLPSARYEQGREPARELEREVSSCGNWRRLWGNLRICGLLCISHWAVLLTLVVLGWTGGALVQSLRARAQDPSEFG